MLSTSLKALHAELGIPADYAESRGLPLFAEALELDDVGPNLIGRMQRLAPPAASAWRSMVGAAREEGLVLMVVSGFRSFDYQASLIRKKLKAGQAIGDILTVNAAPGCSEHHSGLAVDIASPGSRPLTEDFEGSDAFRWLQANAGRFGFSMSYPRNNKYGFVYEPWHWAMAEA